MSRVVMIALLVAVIAAGCLRITDAEGNTATLTRVENSLAGVVTGQEAQQSKLKAMVKGSIYETGDQVTVFGTCMNENDEGWPNSTGTLSAWYPNGTVMFTNVTLQKTWDGIAYQEGYFLYTSPMDAVPGTYLTEFQCTVPEYDGVAKAWGEWQNPMWVRRIGEIQNATNLTQQQLLQFANTTQEQYQNITQQISDLNSSTENWFNITWTKIDNTTVFINETYNNLTTQINYVAVVANASVDRNDSYLASLIWFLINGTGISLNNSLYVNETSVDIPMHKKVWNIEVQVRNDRNSVVGFPLVGCDISTTNTPPTVNETMDPIGSDTNARFTHSEKVYMLPGDDFNWTVSCYYR